MKLLPRLQIAAVAVSLIVNDLGFCKPNIQ